MVCYNTTIIQDSRIENLHVPYLFVCLEDVAPECVVWHFTSDVAEDLHVLRVVRHIEDPAGRGRERGRKREGGGQV